MTFQGLIGAWGGIRTIFIEKERNVIDLMDTKKIVLAVILMMLVAASQAFGMSDDSVYLRLDWKPGETFDYRCDMKAEVRMAREHVNMQMIFNVALRVLDFKNQAESGWTIESPHDITYNESFALA